MLFNDHQYLLLGMLVLLLPFIPGSKYLLPAKKSYFLTLLTPLMVLELVVVALAQH